MWQDGIITTGESEVIACPGMTSDAYRRTRLGQRYALRPVPGQPERELVSGASFVVSGHECVGGGYFRFGQMAFFSFGLSSSEFEARFGERTEDAEALELDFYLNWVESEIGHRPPLDFSWGNIGADFDSKAQVTGIYLQYA